MAKHEFGAQVGDLLNLMIHSLYSNKEIFLRELVSNASDALDKLNYLSLTNDEYKSICDGWTPKIWLEIDKDKKILSLSDNGIGMDEAELIANLGTIANSGTKGFLSKLSGDAKKDAQLIGQFGVGFYSAFMVADKIEVKSLKAGTDQAFLWTSDTNGYEIQKCQKDSFGTQIILHLKDDEYCESFRIDGIIKKYSNHISYPIFMDMDEWVAPSQEEKEAGKNEGHYESVNKQLNKASALWQLNKASLKQSDYDEFYKQISHDSAEPLMHIHTKAEGKIEYTTLFYIPSNEPFDLFRMDYESGVKLYVKRVFITDDAKELLPSYLRFVRGIMDVEDLPLNVSREILQENRILASVKDQSVKKILSELEKLQKSDFEKYKKFFKLFGKVLKEGLYGFASNKDEILKLCLFKSSLNDELITLSQYKEKMQENQKSIYYISGQNENLLKNSPLLEGFKAQNINVLICDEEIDTIVMPMVSEFDGTSIKNINSTSTDEELNTNKDEKTAENTELNGILAKMKEILKDDVKDVRISSRLADWPACIVFDKNDPDFAMQSMLKQMGHEAPKIKPILEINAKHELFAKLKDNELMLNDITSLLFDSARLALGMNIEDAPQFCKRLNKIMLKAL